VTLHEGKFDDDWEFHQNQMLMRASYTSLHQISSLKCPKRYQWMWPQHACYKVSPGLGEPIMIS
jgi:hypothetical protein